MKNNGCLEGKENQYTLKSFFFIPKVTVLPVNDLCFVLALNTTPAIVVPVFRGLGACPPSKRPPNAAFLERGSVEGQQRRVSQLIHCIL